MTKTQNTILDTLKQGPFEFNAEWITDSNCPGPSNLQCCVKGAQMYYGASGLRNVDKVKLTEVSRTPGRKNARKFTMSGPTVIITYKVE